MLIVLGYGLAVFVGVVMGLLGGGGAILSVPIFVYLFNIPASTASGYSLFVVGASSLLGAVQYHRQRLLHLRTGFLFGIPSIVGVYISRRWVVPALPGVILNTPVHITKDGLILIIFACLMILASVFMIRKRKTISPHVASTPSLIWLIFMGIAVGCITGFVGAGGGFIIIPALIGFAHLQMKQAVATSLMIIAMSALLGFCGDVQTHAHIDWLFLIQFLTLSALGLYAGIAINKKIPSQTLKPLFGYFVLCIGVLMLVKEIF